MLSAPPNATPSQLRDALISGAGDAEWSPDTGRGVVNAGASMSELQEAAPV